VTLVTLLAVGSSLLFAASGVSCMLGPDMRSEFGRFGLDRVRTLTGALELVGAGGLMVGLWWPPALRLAAGGLALLMVCAVAVRLRQRDTPWPILPAALLVGVNGWILATSLRS
jgi:hypothetical protein